MKYYLLSLVVAGSLGFYTSAQAILVSRLGGQAYYDTVLDITWLTNTRLAASNTFGLSGINVDGSMTLDTTNAWIQAMNANAYFGYTDWRLPTISPVNGGAFNMEFHLNGSTDIGYNISAPGSIYAGTTVSEMAYMYYNNLGNPASVEIAENTIETGCHLFVPDYCLINRGPFDNLAIYNYWSSQANPDHPNASMVFFFRTGRQFSSGNNAGDHYAWAVRSGDVTVPIPTAIWLFGSGLVGLLAIPCNRRKTSLRGKHLLQYS